jgi:hypothetical protein
LLAELEEFLLELGGELQLLILGALERIQLRLLLF